MGECLGNLLVLAGERHCSRQAARDFGGKARAGENGGCCLRHGFGQNLRQQTIRRLLDPLRAEHDRLSRRDVGRELLQHAAHVLRRRHHQDRVGRRRVLQVRRGAQAFVEGDAGQEGGVLMGAVDARDDLALARPERHAAARLRRHLGECGAPGAGADHGYPVVFNTQIGLPPVLACCRR